MQPEFQLGSLYDRRTDNLLPSLTLWKEEPLEKKGFTETESSEKEWFVDSQNTFSSKIRNLNIEDGLMLSVMSEMVDLKGHAKYLNDILSSRKKAKVSITYKETTVYRELNSYAIHNSDYSKQIKDYERGFTHIVVGIQYGGMFTMVFERDVKENEKKEDIEKSLCAVLNEFPLTKFNLRVKEEYKTILDDTENFKCIVYSDLKFDDTRVSDWDEALKLYKSFSSNFTKSSNTHNKGVPVKIRLLPKTFFKAKHDVLSKELQSNIVVQSQDVIESLINAINESQDLLNDLSDFPILNNKISRFLETVKRYKKFFAKDILRGLLKSIRSGSVKEELLIDAFKQHNQSAFGSLNEWLQKIKKVAKLLFVIQNQLPDDLVSFSNDPYVQDPGKKIRIVLLLKVCKNQDKFIDEMLRYYQNPKKNETVVTTEKILDEENWIEDQSFILKMQQMVNQIRNFASSNSRNKDIGFYLKQEEPKDKPECTIEVWKKFNRLDFNKSFEPPTQVQDLHVESFSHNTIEIKWNVPEEGLESISNYSVEVHLLKDENTAEKSKLVNQELFSPKSDDKLMSYRAKNLEQGKTYEISVKCLSLNDIASSESKTLTQMTRNSYPVANLKATLQEKRQVMLSWEYDDGGKNLKNFLIEYKSSNDISWQCKSADADERTYTLSNLCFATCYKFRVQNFYDGEEDVQVSEEVNQTTEPMGKVQIRKVK